MYKYILCCLIASSVYGAQEVSVFGAGDLNSKNPYGLNSSEKHILNNKKKLTTLSSKVSDVKLLIQTLNRRIEGLESIYEGDSSKLNSTVIKMNNLMKKVDLSSDVAAKNSTDAAEIKNVSEQLLNMNEENEKEMRKSIGTLKRAVSKISRLVNKINSQYVSEKELKANMNQFVTRSEFEALKKAVGIKSGSSKPTVKSNNSSKSTEVSNKKLTSAAKKDLLVAAKKDFSKRNFTIAIPKFEKLIELNYKPAESNYYLAEMWYVRKKYDIAINHFKTSAILYDQAAYMPTLLLHSAISFEKTKDKENARSFYSTLIDLYPGSSESKIAEKNLSKI
jgi:TolA-binding protein